MLHGLDTEGLLNSLPPTPGYVGMQHQSAMSQHRLLLFHPTFDTLLQFCVQHENL
jgi:hypothetical protein